MSAMGLLDRLRGISPHGSGAPSSGGPTPTVLGGRETLEVVGESYYQECLWRIVGGFRTERVRQDVQAVIVPEPTNPFDSNAIQVMIDGALVGYLGREDAAVYRTGLKVLMDRYGGPIALMGCVVGGGRRPDGPGMLGVFLDHDPSDFGLGARQFSHIGELRTGLSQALATDVEDDSYDLSWYRQLSGHKTAQDIVTLRRLLAGEEDPIDRHFMLSELGRCLYASRDAFASALDEFDTVCEQHDSEMASIRQALVDKFGCVPVIEMYRQAAIRCQKAHDWPRVRSWAQRGLTVYGTQAARPEALEDLLKRLAHAEAKLARAGA